MKRRDFSKKLTMGGLLIGAGLNPLLSSNLVNKMVSPLADGDPLFHISLAEWSFNKSLFGKKMSNLDFAAKARSLGINGIEYVNQFFKDSAEDTNYLKELNKRADYEGVKQLLIMVDGEGGLAVLDKKERMKAVENHYRWVHAAKYLGCHSIRVNAYGEGTSKEVAKAAVDGLGRVAEYAAKVDINVIVENHGGYSSNGKWLAGVMKQINMSNCGTLPDFGNFCIKRKEGDWRTCEKEYDKYKGVTELMPYAKAVSAKSNVFNAQGDEANIDYKRMMKIVTDFGYHGYVGIEYEGQGITEEEGVLATKKLLQRVREELHANK